MRAMFSLCLVLVVVFVSMVESRLGSQQRITPPMGVSPQMQGAMGGYGFGTSGQAFFSFPKRLLSKSSIMFNTYFVLLLSYSKLTIMKHEYRSGSDDGK